MQYRKLRCAFLYPGIEQRLLLFIGRKVVLDDTDMSRIERQRDSVHVVHVPYQVPVPDMLYSSVAMPQRLTILARPGCTHLE